MKTEAGHNWGRKFFGRRVFVNWFDRRHSGWGFGESHREYGLLALQIGRLEVGIWRKI